MLMLMEYQATVVVPHPMEAEAEDMAAVTEAAATEIHLDLAGSLPGGRCHYRILGASSPGISEMTDLARWSPGAWPQCPITSQSLHFS